MKWRSALFVEHPYLAGVGAELDDPCGPCNGYEYSTGDAGDEQGHAQGECALEAEEHYPGGFLVLQDEDDQQHQQDKGRDHGHPDYP